MSVSSALQKLASYRQNNSRVSQDVFEKGALLLKAGAAPQGEEGWPFLEQLALASIDTGRLDVADLCIQKLTDKFPGSPRVEVLTGIRLEASEPTSTVIEYYYDLLQADSTNAAAWKRMISVLRRRGNIEKATEDLIQYLDIFYTDPEGWLELADIYVSCHQYTSALQALSHALLLNPQNPFTFLQFAETAYSSGDIPLALKMFLVVVEMVERDLDAPGNEPPIGIAFRAWWGVKLCARHLVESPNATSSSPTKTPVPKHVHSLDTLATERVLSAYSGKQLNEHRHLVESWISTK